MDGLIACVVVLWLAAVVWLVIVWRAARPTPTDADEHEDGGIGS
jgi:hypothetical protein